MYICLLMYMYIYIYIYIYTYLCLVKTWIRWSMVNPTNEGIQSFDDGNRYFYIIIYIYTCLCVRNHPGIDKTRTVQTYSSFTVGCLDFGTPGWLYAHVYTHIYIYI